MSHRKKSYNKVSIKNKTPNNKQYLGFSQALLQLFDLGRVLGDSLLLDIEELLQRHLLLLELLELLAGLLLEHLLVLF